MLRLILFTILATIPSPAALLHLSALDFTLGDSVGFKEDGTDVSGFAGVINGNYDGGPSIQLVCVDLFTNISVPSDADSTPYLPRAWRFEDRAAWLVVNVLPFITTVTQGQALQLAIWDIIHDSGTGLLGSGAGRIQASTATPSAVVTQWETYLTDSLGQSTLAASIYVNTEPGTGNPLQTLMGALQPGSPMAPTPEPGTFALLGAGAAGLALARKLKPLR